MSGTLTLLLLPALVGWWIPARARKITRAALREAIAAAPAPVLADAGRSPVTTVARSLELHPGARAPRRTRLAIGRQRRADDVRALVAPLGLELTALIGVRRDLLGRTRGFFGATRFVGVRHGRAVRVELGANASSVIVSAAGATASFAIVGDTDGRLLARGVAPAPVAAALERLRPSRHWRGLEIAVTPDGVVLGRSGTIAGSWLHDLWLAELVADLASPLTDAAPSDETARSVFVGAPLPGTL